MSEVIKANEVDYLNSAPAGWKVMKMRQAFSFGKGLSITKENLTEEGIPVVSYGQIHSKTNTGTGLNESLIRYVPDVYLRTGRQSLAKRNDVLFADTSEDYLGVGNCAFVDTDDSLFAGYHTIIARPYYEDCNPKYLAYQFQTDFWRSQLRSRVMGIKVFSVSQALLRSTFILMPSKKEQDKIVEILDVKCSKLDKAIEEIIEQIAILSSYKKSLITETLFHGLKAAEDRKESGYDWIGTIPSHWDVKPLKYVCALQPTCRTKRKFKSSDKVTFLPMDHIKNGFYINEEAELGDNDSSYTEFEENDVLLAKVTPCFENGNITIARGLTNGCGFGSSELFVFRTDNVQLDTEYLFYWLQNLHFISTGTANMTGSAGLKRVPADFIKRYPVLLPPIDEQREIAGFLRSQCATLENIIENKNAQLEIIRNHKQALIYEYITGKKRVKEGVDYAG